MSRKERWTWLGLAVIAALVLLFLAREVGAVDGGREFAWSECRSWSYASSNPLPINRVTATIAWCSSGPLTSIAI